MTSVAVIAHAKKELQGGLPELRRILSDEGVTDPWWREVSKSKQVGMCARAALEDGADLIFVWEEMARCNDAWMPSRDRVSRSRSCPPAPRTCSRPTSVSRRISRGPSAWDFTAPGAHWTSG